MGIGVNAPIRVLAGKGLVSGLAFFESGLDYEVVDEDLSEQCQDHFEDANTCGQCQGNACKQDGDDQGGDLPVYLREEIEQHLSTGENEGSEAADFW
ncbi:hypothetical protein [Cyclobacterium jeungdonense]|uniref:Uncharacterized protein n=1 Tax=Cyclobacterium jeungdonense TaxID=708087 RepID=A0ABT8C9I8_9BACT|nr:hypothetical protein [Cyclobacterium jeungdonense]MDN3688694.1 hypothetical protein [Cyclobacterium jeungdonense]